MVATNCVCDPRDVVTSLPPPCVMPHTHLLRLLLVTTSYGSCSNGCYPLTLGEELGGVLSKVVAVAVKKVISLWAELLGHNALHGYSICGGARAWGAALPA